MRRVVLYLLAVLAAPAYGEEPRNNFPSPQEPGAREEAGASPASTPGEDLLRELEQIDQMTLADVLQAPVAVATATPQTVRRSPGILTVVTREEIEAYGARDLMEVLQLVPGFAFGSDVQGAVGVGFRGLWGHEGKVLLLVDGHELNETLYLTTQFNAHFPVDDIERVEVIRGPGSVIYGGYAELAVIQVVTRGAAGHSGAAATARYGLARGLDYSQRGLGLSLGHTFESGLYLAASASLGQARQSLGDYTDFSGDRISLRDQSALTPAMASADARWKGLSVGLLCDGYTLDDRTGFGQNLAAAVPNGFNGLYARASYEAKLGESMTLTPYLRYKRQAPWQVLTDDPAAAEALFYDKTAQRLTGGLRYQWRPLVGLDVLAGVEGQYDHASIGRHGPGRGDEYVGLNQPFDGAASVSYDNLAGYLQLLWENPIVNASAGGRVEWHSAYGTSFVPRVGLTKEYQGFHAKALYSRAFKAPGIENIRLNPAIAPEKAGVLELEVGYLLRDMVMLTVNAYDLSIDGPIVYGTDTTGAESYLNAGKTGSRGVEVELRVRHGRGFGAATYSLYSAAGKNSVEAYAVPSLSAPLLGLPNHKLTLAGSVEVLKGLRVGTTVVALGPRYGFLEGADGVSQVSRTGWQVVWNAQLSWRVPGLEALTVGVGGYNLLDQRVLYIQPYDGGHAPLPGMSRELGLRLALEQG